MINSLICDVLTGNPEGITPQIEARIGISCGAVVFGALGSLQPRLHIRGRAMEDAEMLEQSGRPGMVHASQDVVCMLSDSDRIQDFWLGDTTQPAPALREGVGII